MIFTRKKKIGQNAKTRKLWVSAEGYRIVWRREVLGISVPPGFQATVRVALATGEIWDFAGARHGLYKTLKRAQEVCEKHHKLWTNACAATGIREFRDLIGAPLGIPVFARQLLNQKLQKTLTKGNHEDDLPSD